MFLTKYPSSSSSSSSSAAAAAASSSAFAAFPAMSLGFIILGEIFCVCDLFLF